MKNRCDFIGRTTKDVEYTVSPEGKGRAVFTIAVEDGYTVNQGEKKVEFIRIKAFGKLAENIANYVGKGSLIGVECRYSQSSYQKDGQTHYTHDFICMDVEFLLTKKPGEAEQNQSQGQGINQQPTYQQQPQYSQQHVYQQPPAYQQPPSYPSQPQYSQQPQYAQNQNGGPSGQYGNHYPPSYQQPPIEVSQDDLPF